MSIWWHGAPGWQKATAIIIGFTGFCEAVGRWDAYYEDRGLVHPITAWISARIPNEEESRRERILDMYINSEAAERRYSLMQAYA